MLGHDAGHDVARTASRERHDHRDGASGLASAYQSGGSAQALGGIIGGRIPNSRI
jgi:hypothetical protein